jgi:hypothetical protein
MLLTLCRLIIYRNKHRIVFNYDYFLRPFYKDLDMKLLKYLVYLVLVLLSISFAYVLLIINNKIELKPDARYSQIDLKISTSPISKELNQLVSPNSPDHEHRKLIDELDITSRAPDQEIGQAQLSEDQLQRLETLKASFNRYVMAFSEDGCLDDIQGWNHKSRPKSLRLMSGFKLIRLFMIRDRMKFQPNEVFEIYFPLLQVLHQKELSCHHNLINFMIFNVGTRLLDRELMSLMKQSQLSPKYLKEILDHWNKRFDFNGQKQHIHALQNAFKVEHLQTNKMTELELSNAIPQDLGVNSSPILWPFWDAEQTKYWLTERARADVWLAGQTYSDLEVNDLEVDSLLKKFKTPYLSYNTIGQILFSVTITASLPMIRKYHQTICERALEWSKLLASIGQVVESDLVNPLTQKRFDLSQSNKCDSANRFE